MDMNDIKKRLGFKAVDELVKDRMKIGLGTGSTAVFAIKRIRECLNEGKLTSIFCVPTSMQAELECRRYNISTYSLNDTIINGELDLTIDGADEVDPEWNLIKGGGGALFMEKIVGFCSENYAIVVDETKITKQLGQSFQIPVEVLPYAMVPVSRALEKTGASLNVRLAQRKAGPVITRYGNIIIDISFREPFNPAILEQKLNSIPGVIENGIFTLNVTDVFIGYKNGNVKHLRKNK